MIYYYPNYADVDCCAHGAVVLPATVVQVFGERINIAVTCMNEKAPVVIRFSVPHKSQVPKVENSKRLAEMSYWDWTAKI